MKKYLTVFLAMSAAASFAWSEPQKKLISTGWMIPRNLEYYQIPAEKIEKDLPFDGINIGIDTTIIRDGKSVHYWVARNTAKSPIWLQKEDFKEWVETFQKLKFKRLKHNFIGLNSSQFSPDWFDDKAWAKTINNHKVLTWLAKNMNCKGFILDTEGYPFTGQPFAFRPQWGKSFAETEAKVRERGAQWIKAIAEEYPDITIFCYIWSSDVYGLRYSQKKADTVVETLALQRAFMNGVYDAIPETVRIIDGNEDFGYHCATEADFDKVAADFRYYPRRIIAKENLGKYYKHTSMAFSLYLDSYMPGNRAPYNIWTKANGNPAKLLHRNIERCFERADEYVWIWAERGTFMPQLYPGHRYKAWDTYLPHTTEAIRAGRDPLTAAKKYAGKNVLKNSSMDPGPAAGITRVDNIHTVSYWYHWQPKTSNGKITAADGGIKFEQVRQGSVNQYYPGIKPGKRYLITAKAKVDGDMMVPKLSCTFWGKDTKGRHGRYSTRKSAVFGPEEKDGWRKAYVLIDIPEDDSIAYAGICCAVGSAAGAAPGDINGSVHFDDVTMQEVIYPWDK